MGLFTPAEAREELTRLRPVLAELVAVRADTVELGAALRGGGAPTSLGGLPEWKAAQARLNELMTTVQESGAELKGIARAAAGRLRRRAGRGAGAAVLAGGGGGAGLVSPARPRLRRAAPAALSGRTPGVAAC